MRCGRNRKRSASRFAPQFCKRGRRWRSEPPGDRGTLGHSQPATTARYAHLAASPLHQAADAIGAQIEAAMSGRGRVRCPRIWSRMVSLDLTPSKQFRLRIWGSGVRNLFGRAIDINDLQDRHRSNKRFRTAFRTAFSGVWWRAGEGADLPGGVADVPAQSAAALRRSIATVAPYSYLIITFIMYSTGG